MKQYFLALMLCILSFSYSTMAQPTVEQFKQVFYSHMQKLKTDGFTKRTILFSQVIKGTPNGGYYPFKVTAYIHDYGPGYPTNRYYGQTCAGKMDGWKFDMLKDDFGQWIVQGRFTVSNSTCKDNLSEGTEAIPVSSLEGTAYNPGLIRQAPLPENKAQKKTIAKNTTLYIGEYACYGTGGRLMAGMGFTLKPNGTYVDLDNERGGTYTYNPQNATLSFKGGFLSGQTGKNVKQTGFQLSNTVSCEPWR